MKIRLIIKEIIQHQLPENPYNMEVVRKVRNILGTFLGNPEYFYGWLFPDGSSSEISTIHGEVMAIVDENYDEDAYEHRGPSDFGRLTGSIRVGDYSGYKRFFHLFTKITPKQLAWIRKNFAGKEILISFEGEDYFILESSISEWSKNLNSIIVQYNLASFDVLSENKKIKAHNKYKLFF